MKQEKYVVLTTFLRYNRIVRKVTGGLDMATLDAMLQKSMLFQDIPEEVIRREIVPHGYQQEYQKKQFLIVPQQRVDQLGILLSGRVHIQHLFVNGDFSLMSTLTVGDVLGADLVFTRSRISPYHAMTAAATQIFYLPCELLTRPGMLNEQSRLCALNRMLTLISNVNMKKEYRLAILSQKGLRERIVTYLSMQANRQRKATFTVPFSREDMASFLCVNRSALSHELSLMQNEGLISFHKNTFTLHNWEPDFQEGL